MLNKNTLYFTKDYFLRLYPRKFCYWKVFPPTCNNISEQNYLDNIALIFALYPQTPLLQK